MINDDTGAMKSTVLTFRWILIIIFSICILVFSVVYCLQSANPLPILNYKILKRTSNVLNLNITDAKDEANMLPIIYFITPTYKRSTQRLDLIRLANTLNNVPRLHWVVVEDAFETSVIVQDVLTKSHVWKWTQLAAKSPKPENNPHNHRGINQRNKGLLHVVEISSTEDKESAGGVLYFGDDDNAYDLQLFEEMRSIKKVGCWAMAFAAGRSYERCTIDPMTGLVNGWASQFRDGRVFLLDMAAFAVNMKIISESISQGVWPLFSHSFRGGHLEDRFLQYFLKNISELEPKGDCTKIWVWHVKTDT